MYICGYRLNNITNHDHTPVGKFGWGYGLLTVSNKEMYVCML